MYKLDAEIYLNFLNIVYSELVRLIVAILFKTIEFKKFTSQL